MKSKAEKADILFAILFVSSSPVPLADIKEKLGITHSELMLTIKELKEKLKETPLMLLETENSVTLVTRPEYAEYIRRFRSLSPQRLSDAALETLAIIIQKQPCTRQEIEVIRGTDCEKTLSTLINAKLIRPIGNLKQPGAPVMYAITEECLFRFGVKSYRELQSLCLKKV